ncbi:MAG: DNA alkylation repair protein [Candidatus Pristimantibacillus sp.]
MSEPTALKHFFDERLANRLSDLIVQQYPSFPSKSFIQEVVERIPSFELKGRVAVIADALHHTLPEDYPTALRILSVILGPENKTEEGMFTNGYFLMPIAYFVEKYGLEYVELSLEALYEITKRHTSEYAIRPYLTAHTDLCLAKLREWLDDPNPHVRRLVSEGTRTRLPWAKRISILHGDLTIHLGLLEPLLDDPSMYVRKSVANHLNDLTKEQAHQETILIWLKQHARQGGKHRKWIIRTGLRTLLKQGEPSIQEFLKEIGEYG